MRINFAKPDCDWDARTIAAFGQARLVRRIDGRLELRGGSPDDRTAAKEWISLFMHEAVPALCPDRRIGKGGARSASQR